MLSLAAFGAKFGVVDIAAGAEPGALREVLRVANLIGLGVPFGVGTGGDGKGQGRTVIERKLFDVFDTVGDDDGGQGCR